MNTLIVESENDQYFVEALINEMGIKGNKVLSVDQFIYSSLDKKKLTTKISSVLDIARYSEKVGIILDMDDSNKLDRISLVNECLVDAFIERGYPRPENLLSDVNKFVENDMDDLLKVKVSCFFTNVNGEGELETVLKSIKTKTSYFADCLYDGWCECLVKKGLVISDRGNACDISKKEILKLWVDFYKRFDTLKKSDRNEKNTNWQGIMLGEFQNKGRNTKLNKVRGGDIFDLKNDEILGDIKSFLAMFS